MSDESLKGLLKDERLQKEILTIDAADDREKVLQDALSKCQLTAVLNVCVLTHLLHLDGCRHSDLHAYTDTTHTYIQSFLCCK